MKCTTLHSIIVIRVFVCVRQVEVKKAVPKPEMGGGRGGFGGRGGRGDFGGPRGRGGRGMGRGRFGGGCTICVISNYYYYYYYYGYLYSAGSLNAANVLNCENSAARSVISNPGVVCAQYDEVV